MKKSISIQLLIDISKFIFIHFYIHFLIKTNPTCNKYLFPFYKHYIKIIYYLGLLEIIENI